MLCVFAAPPRPKSFLFIRFHPNVWCENYSPRFAVYFADFASLESAGRRPFASMAFLF